jgi:hypothetical protein
MIKLSELINEEIHTEDGPSIIGRSDEHFWHLKQYITAAKESRRCIELRADRCGERGMS